MAKQKKDDDTPKEEEQSKEAEAPQEQSGIDPALQERANTLQAIIAELEAKPNRDDDDEDALAEARQQLQQVGGGGGTQVVTVTEGLDPDVVALLEGMRQAMQAGTTPASVDEIRDVVLDVLKTKKIDKADLSDALKAEFVSVRPVELVIQQVSTKVDISTISADQLLFINQPLTQEVLSDMQARNNVYLYGSAGTGKTYLAGELAKILGWKKITINCDQFTSRIDIIGGQTIEGYQEGKLSMAWANIDENGKPIEEEGCILLIDELPKCDPNTAGLFNEPLAKVKDIKVDPDGNEERPVILNGRNKPLTLGNLFIIATGNVPLNTIDPDYEANFKQDLSLQDRFVGSTYQVHVNYDYEYNVIMRGYAFIWIFCTYLREAIIQAKATSQAFVSLRIMTSLKATYNVYRTEGGSGAGIKKAKNLIDQPKTLEEAFLSFFKLFKKGKLNAILQNVEDRGMSFDQFKAIVAEKNKMPYSTDPDVPNNFNTPEEEALAEQILKQHSEKLEKEKSLTNE